MMRWHIKLTQKTQELIIGVTAQDLRGAVLDALSIYRNAQIIAIRKDGESFIDFHPDLVKSASHPTRFKNLAIDIPLSGERFGA